MELMLRHTPGIGQYGEFLDKTGWIKIIYSYQTLKIIVETFRELMISNDILSKWENNILE